MSQDTRPSKPDLEPKHDESKVTEPLVLESYKYEELVKYSKELQNYENLSDDMKKILDSLNPTSKAIYHIIDKWYENRIEKLGSEHLNTK